MTEILFLIMMDAVLRRKTKMLRTMMIKSSQEMAKTSSKSGSSSFTPE